ncbi:MAG: hypothetical protein IMZ61_10800, partial [Planctomycetes bacterium]|nr:hypothetical protein [Planctomycetota bacterium]
MNRIFRFKMAVRTGLIITLLLAVVMAAGCPKKQDKSAKTPASNDTKSPKHDTQIKSPPAEANGLSVVTSPEPAVNKKEMTADKTPPKAADTKPATQQKAPLSPQLKAPAMPQPADLKPFESLKTADEKIDFITEFADAHPESTTALVYKALD